MKSETMIDELMKPISHIIVDELPKKGLSDLVYIVKGEDKCSSYVWNDDWIPMDYGYDECNECILKHPVFGCIANQCDPITREEAIVAVKIQKKQIIGRWIFDEDGLLRCSECELIPINKVETHDRLVYEIKQITKYMRFCPRCGAKMEVSE